MAVTVLGLLAPTALSFSARPLCSGLGCSETLGKSSFETLFFAGLLPSSSAVLSPGDFAVSAGASTEANLCVLFVWFSSNDFALEILSLSVPLGGRLFDSFGDDGALPSNPKGKL